MPCLELWEKQNQHYKNELLESNQKYIQLRQGVNKDLRTYVMEALECVILESAPAGDLQKHFEFTKEDITKKNFE